MSRRPAILLFYGGCLLQAALAHAQVTYSIGPQVGLNISSARYAPDERYASYGVVITADASYRPGLEVGVAGSIGFGHFLVQPALLYSQKGFQLAGTQSDLTSTDGTRPAPYQVATRQNYLTLPLNFTYAQCKNGQGVHVFAGPYLGLLVGGTQRFTRPSTALVVEITSDVKGGQYPADFDPYTDRTRYAQRLDAGLQVGLGYQWHQVAGQATYSVGLRNLAPTNFQAQPFIGTGPDYSNRVFQLSLAYLFRLSR